MGADAGTRPMEIDDLFRFQRVAEPQLSPDGRWVVYQVGQIDLETRKTTTSLWLATTDRLGVGGATTPRRLTEPVQKNDRHPRWAPDGRRILFESDRSGTSQLWVIDIHGGEARQLTRLSSGAATGIWSPDGSKIAFVSAVYPEYSELEPAESDKKNKERAEQAESGPVKARVTSRLFLRHWDSYVDGKRQHLFVCDADGQNCRDVTPGDRDAYPTSTTFSVGDDFVFSPDSRAVIFTAVPAKNEAWNTGYEFCRAVIDRPTTEWQSIVSVEGAAVGCPRFSPDGRHLAYRAQQVPGYEADRWRLSVVPCQPDGQPTGKGRSLTENLDRSCDELWWLGDERLGMVAEQQASRVVYCVTLDGRPAVQTAVSAGQIGSVSVGGTWLGFQLARMDHPAEVFVHPLQNSGAQIGLPVATESTMISHANDGLRAELKLSRPKSVEVPVEGNVKMQMWILEPPGFDPSKKWPVAFLVHGGPQGAWEDGWSFRWCAQAWAAQGYVVAMPNPRGSTGFGQQYVREISGDWGGKVYRDLMAGLDYLVAQPWCDSQRIGAAGASFGGYMMNWFAVNTDRFQCLISHCSVWNLESMWGTTDELWFDEFEHGGVPWEIPDKYREFSPHVKAANLARFRTPMLVIHNDLDFRCPIGQGLELFTTLQRLGVPSKFVNFPDEGHWVTKPANSRFWHEQTFDWLKTYVPPGPR